MGRFRDAGPVGHAWGAQSRFQRDSQRLRLLAGRNAGASCAAASYRAGRAANEIVSAVPVIEARAGICAGCLADAHLLSLRTFSRRRIYPCLW